MKTFWISFASETAFLGVVITDAEDETAAIHKLTQLQLNPGGEAMICDLSVPGAPLLQEVSRFGKDRLIGRAEFDRSGYKSLSQASEEECENLASNPSVKILCQACNEGTCRVHKQ